MMPFRPLVFPHRPAAGNLIRAGEYRQDGTLAVRADLPGTDPGTDVELTVSDGILHIEAERRPQDKPEEKGHLHQEVRYGSSSRSPRLPQGATEAGITATCKDGVLEIRIPEPRHEEAKKKIAISNGVRVSWRTVPAFAAGVLATLAAAVLVLCRGPARADAPATDRIVRWWAAAWLRAAGARVTVHGLERVRADTTYVVVSNHQSNLDPMVHLRALPLSLRILAMRELFRIWLLGRALRAIGMIEVDRASPDLGQIDQAATRCLAAGHSLLIYPEGGTTPDEVIGEFKDGAFVIAVTSQVPVLPVAIDGTCRIWPPGRTAIHGGQVRIVVGSPLPTSGLAHHDIPALREQARDVICSARRALDTTTS